MTDCSFADIPGRCEAAVPPLSVQTLVEDVKYAVAPKRKAGSIAVSAIESNS